MIATLNNTPHVKEESISDPDITFVTKKSIDGFDVYDFDMEGLILKMELLLAKL